MSANKAVIEKIGEIKSEMKEAGLWHVATPAWVEQYDAEKMVSVQDFSAWLQFIYLPNQTGIRTYPPGEGLHYIVPQAKHFLGNHLRKGKLLQLLIELDGLS